MSKKILKCPKCGSTNIIPEAGFVTGYKYHCEDCDYVGSLILEVYEEELEKLEKMEEDERGN
ncbi:MAG: TFIIB-type zinc ribbon-containing protein [Thermoplasmata archaeon]